MCTSIYLLRDKTKTREEVLYVQVVEKKKVGKKKKTYS